jgi:hypothetical protein
VNYKGFESEKVEFQKYLDSLSAVSSTEYSGFTKEQKLSFLINAYNAFTIRLILDNYPIKSIRKIGILPGAAWKKDFFKLLDKERNLDWIEHQKLRKDFQEPRIHFAIVCASIGCPPLLSEAFIPAKLNSQLQSNMEFFLKDSTKNRYDASSQTLYLSPIFKWFQEDFTKEGTLVQFIKNATKQNIPDSTKIEYTDYNWNLNE